MNLAQVPGSTGLAAITALLNSGTLVMYSGSQPATPETALSGNNVLATWTFTSSAFAAPSFGSGNETALANFAAASVAPTANGTVSFARAFKSGGTVPVADFTVSTSGADINLGSITISTGTNVDLSSFSISLPVS